MLMANQRIRSLRMLGICLLRIICAQSCFRGSLAEKMNSGDLLQYRPGQILIAGAIQVHKRGNEACSDILDDGVQAVETMNMMVDKINNDSKLLPNITLGTIMIDTCDIDSHALKRVVRDVLPLIWGTYDSIASDRLTTRPNVTSSLLAGLVGAVSSAVSIQIANVLQVFSIPQVSYWSTSPALSNKARFKYFFRVVPSDKHQARAMMILAQERKWNYLSVVYEDDSYGIHGEQEIQNIAGEYGICIALSQPVPRSPKDSDYKKIVDKLIAKQAQAVIVFAKLNDASKLMLAAQEIGGKALDIIWIGSDAWAGLLPKPKSLLQPRTLDGSIAFMPSARQLKDFDSYFRMLTLEQNQGNFRNPWFAEYISIKNNCSLDEVSDNGKRKCAAGEKVENFLQLDVMENVANSVLAFAKTLDQYQKDVCGGQTGLCQNMKKLQGTNKLPAALYSYLKNLSFTGVRGNNITFDENQDGPTIYDVLNFKADKEVGSGFATQKWFQAGTYQNEEIVWEKNLTDKVKSTNSVCSKPCKMGEAKITGEQMCCWYCQTCNKNQFVSANGTSCVNCASGYKPNRRKTGCISLPFVEIEYGSTNGIVCTVAGCFGLTVTVLIGIIFIVYRNSAIVKASGRELCYFVFFGLIITFLNFLSLSAPPSDPSCVLSRLAIGIGPTCIYAGLLAKTARVVIIFQSKSILSPRLKAFIKPLPQICWTCALVSIEVIILIVWLGISGPGVKMFYRHSELAYRSCAHLVELTILIALIYPFILITACTILATINRKVPTGFNETQYIGFSMYTTCVIWLAFLPAFIANDSDPSRKIMIVSICLSLSATTVLLCVFAPRCYKILFHPEENTPASVMSSGFKRTQ